MAKLSITVVAFGALAAAGAAKAQPLDGAALFADSCAACHQAQGQGIAGAFPALARNELVQGPPATVAAVVISGRAGMPSFREELAPPQIAAILTYVRASWGNKAGPIDVATVEAAAKAGSAPDHEKSVLPYGSKLTD